MKRGLLFLCTGVLIHLCCLGQEPDTIGLEDLDIPISPGFILYDQSPTVVARPNTTRAFTLSMLNSFAGTNGFPDNYGIEVTPFWFFRHRNMTALRYAGLHKGRLRPFSPAKMATVSVAFINTTLEGSGVPVNNVVFGGRATLLKIYPRNYKEKLVNANLVTYHDLKGLAETLIREGATDSLLVCCPEAYNEVVLRVSTLFSEREDVAPLKEVLKTRPVLAIDGAVAGSIMFVDNDFSSHQPGRTGAWLTLSFAQGLNKQNTNYFNMYAVGRYLSERSVRDATGNFRVVAHYDLGGRMELEFNNFSLGYEYIYRVSDGKNNTFRSTGMLRYHLAENIYLTGAFGKNFGDSNNLVSLLGINWGLSTGNEKAVIE